MRLLFLLPYTSLSIIATSSLILIPSSSSSSTAIKVSSVFFAASAAAGRTTTTTTTTTTAATMATVDDNIDNIDNNESESTEHLKPWSERWSNQRIGFHLKDVNPIIVKYSSELLLLKSETTVTKTCDKERQNTSTRVFVPLCGKAIDMAYLASLSSSSSSSSDVDVDVDNSKNHNNNNSNIQVVGLDGIRVALEQFIEEHPDLNIKHVAAAGKSTDDDATTTTSSSSSSTKFERFVGDNVTLWKGDYFDLLAESSSEEEEESFDAIYDRASMVAIEPQLRPAYVKILDRLLKPQGKILLVALERKSSSSTEATKKGPPYSIPETTVRELFANLDSDENNENDYSYSITLLEETDQLVEKPEDKKRYPDLDQLLETVYLIQKKRKEKNK